MDATYDFLRVEEPDGFAFISVQEADAWEVFGVEISAACAMRTCSNAPCGHAPTRHADVLELYTVLHN